mgnify:CR=1 FL=1|jgi:hypothetical protein|tara:strand:- start:2013 stop:2315 length:303 start_codon:yes stop_codon:yes gene_type:complete
MVTTITTTIAIMILGYMIFINHKFNKRLDHIELRLMDLDDAIEREAKTLDDANDLNDEKIRKIGIDNKAQITNTHNNVRNNSDRITRIEGLMVDNNWKSY